ncbi:hypothetical protein SOVF_112910 [Spinacia oleracea]|nr:hypothetical protein SOVF_112910 [Spinacia oleracea]
MGCSNYDISLRIRRISGLMIDGNMLNEITNQRKKKRRRKKMLRKWSCQ